LVWAAGHDPIKINKKTVINIIKVYKKTSIVYSNSQKTNIQKSEIIISDDSLISTKPRKTQFSSFDLFEKTLIDIFVRTCQPDLFQYKINILKNEFTQDGSWIEIEYKEADKCLDFTINDILNYPNHKVALQYLEQFLQKGNKENMGSKDFILKVKELVAEYANERLDKSDNKQITVDDVFIVWSCKTLQNNKALASTTLFDGMYYEITYNGDKNEIYFDAYKKWENKCIKLGE